MYNIVSEMQLSATVLKETTCLALDRLLIGMVVRRSFYYSEQCIIKEDLLWFLLACLLPTDARRAVIRGA
jgi:hypothetical protein